MACFKTWLLFFVIVLVNSKALPEPDYGYGSPIPNSVTPRWVTDGTGETVREVQVESNNVEGLNLRALEKIVKYAFDSFTDPAVRVRTIHLTLTALFRGYNNMVSINKLQFECEKFTRLAVFKGPDADIVVICWKPKK